MKRLKTAISEEMRLADAQRAAAEKKAAEARPVAPTVSAAPAKLLDPDVERYLAANYVIETPDGRYHAQGCDAIWRLNPATNRKEWSGKSITLKDARERQLKRHEVCAPPQYPQ